jgi:hypothetical protein
MVSRPGRAHHSPEPASNPAVLLPERFRAETCAFGALIEEGLSD